MHTWVKWGLKTRKRKVVNMEDFSFQHYLHIPEAWIRMKTLLWQRVCLLILSPVYVVNGASLYPSPEKFNYDHPSKQMRFANVIFPQNKVHHDFGITKDREMLRKEQKLRRPASADASALLFVPMPPHQWMRYWLLSSTMICTPHPHKPFCPAPSKYALGSIEWAWACPLRSSFLFLKSFSGNES